MMRLTLRITLSLAIIGLLIAAGSCKKCAICSYEYTSAGTNFKTEFPEKCGSNTDIETYKANCKVLADKANTECTCTEK